MTRRSIPQRDIDERAFPVRLLILVPEQGFGRLIGSGPDTIDTWLDREVGRGAWAHHAAGHFGGRREKTAFYFRHPAGAARFLQAFPQLDLADGTLGREPRPGPALAPSSSSFR